MSEPPDVELPSVRSFVSSTAAAPPPELVIPTGPVKSLAAWSSVTGLPEAVVAPLTARAPVWVSGPLAAAVRPPLIVLAARPSALASTSDTSAALVIPAVDRLFAMWFSVMSFAAPAPRTVGPVTASAPVCVMAPDEFTVSPPLTVLGPSASASESVTATSSALVARNELKLLLAPVSVMSLPTVASKVAAPVGTMLEPTPWVIGPPVSTVNVPLTGRVPSSRLFVSVTVRLRTVLA